MDKVQLYLAVRVFDYRGNNTDKLFGIWHKHHENICVYYYRHKKTVKNRNNSKIMHPIRVPNTQLITVE